MKNTGETFFQFGLLSTVNNFRILDYGAEFSRIGKRVKICLAEPMVSFCEQFFKSLAAIILVEIIVIFAERATGAVAKFKDDVHMTCLVVVR